MGLRVTLAPVAATLTALICFWSVSTSLGIYALLLPLYFLPLKPKKAEQFVGEENAANVLKPRRVLVGVGIAVIVVAWFLFRPELLLLNTRVSENLTTTKDEKILSGVFKGLAHKTTGDAAVYNLQGTYVLRFTRFSTSNGPDVHVYLVAAPDASNDDTIHHAGFINLGKMKGNEGDQNYDLPTGIDLSTYRSVSLWCQRFNVNFGACSLH